MNKLLVIIFTLVILTNYGYSGNTDYSISITIPESTHKNGTWAPLKKDYKKVQKRMLIANTTDRAKITSGQIAFSSAGQQVPISTKGKKPPYIQMTATMSIEPDNVVNDDGWVVGHYACMNGEYTTKGQGSIKGGDKPIWSIYGITEDGVQGDSVINGYMSGGNIYAVKSKSSTKSFAWHAIIPKNTPAKDWKLYYSFPDGGGVKYEIKFKKSGFQEINIFPVCYKGTIKLDLEYTGKEEEIKNSSTEIVYYVVGVDKVVVNPGWLAPGKRGKPGEENIGCIAIITAIPKPDSTPSWPSEFVRKSASVNTNQLPYTKRTQLNMDQYEVHYKKTFKEKDPKKPTGFREGSMTFKCGASEATGNIAFRIINKEE